MSYFWFSEKHLEHYRTMNREYAPVVAAPEWYRPCFDTRVVIDGREVRYTACRDDASNEPYKGALKRFPDYKLIGEAPMEAVVIRGVLA